MLYCWVSWVAGPLFHCLLLFGPLGPLLSFGLPLTGCKIINNTIMKGCIPETLFAVDAVGVVAVVVGVVGVVAVGLDPDCVEAGLQCLDRNVVDFEHHHCGRHV